MNDGFNDNGIYNLYTPSGGYSDNYAASIKFVDDRTVGRSQTWQDVSGSRTLNMLYTNNTIAPIQLSISTGMWATGVIQAFQYNNIIPPGSTYMLNGEYRLKIDGMDVHYTDPSGWTGQGIFTWFELR